MRAVKSVNTGPELIVRRLVFGMGYRYRLHYADLPGKPDLAFVARRKAIYVHGCFWHGHDCPRGARVPKHNTHYWIEKIKRNKARDRENLIKLAKLGWLSHVIWECELLDHSRLKKRLQRFLSFGVS